MNELYTDRAEYEAIMAALEAQCPFEPDECMSECFEDTVRDDHATCLKCGGTVACAELRAALNREEGDASGSGEGEDD